MNGRWARWLVLLAIVAGIGGCIGASIHESEGERAQRLEREAQEAAEKAQREADAREHEALALAWREAHRRQDRSEICRMAAVIYSRQTRYFHFYADLESEARIAHFGCLGLALPGNVTVRGD